MKIIIKLQALGALDSAGKRFSHRWYDKRVITRVVDGVPIEASCTNSTTTTEGSHLEQQTLLLSLIVLLAEGNSS